MDSSGYVLEPGQAFGRFRIERLLGEGAMGEAYLATETELRQEVVIKVLHPQYARKAEVAKRFQREGSALMRIRHPHVVRVLYVDRVARIDYIAMEYLRGCTLGAYLAEYGPLSAQQIADLMIPILEGVAAAHAAGIAHRDLKPENIFVTRDANGTLHPKVMDFGVARVEDEQDGMHTATTAVLGSPAYMSPEQARSTRDADELSDQYSVGVMLYECATGRRPFTGKTVVQVIQSVIRGSFDPPRELRRDLPEGFEEIVLRAMAYNPPLRFRDVRALGFALLPFASPATQRAWEPTLSRPLLADARIPAHDRGRLMRSHAAEAATLMGDLDDGVQHAPAPIGSLARPIVEGATGPADSLGATTTGFTTPDPPRLLRVARMGALLVLAAFSGGGSYWFATSRMQAKVVTGNRAATAPLATMRLSLRASPPTATISLDGRPLGVGRVDHALPPNDQPHELRVAAEGYQPYVVTFRERAPEGAIALVPVAAAPRASDEITEAPLAPGARPDVAPAQGRVRGRATPARPSGRSRAIGRTNQVNGAPLDLR